MRVAVTGGAGLLGKGLVQVFREEHEVFPLTHQDADITDERRMRELVEAIRPDVIVHSAAMPDVDECERNPAAALRVNFEATRALVKIVRDAGARFAFISTDAVFDGKSQQPYVETDAVNPPSVYGRTKAAAEGSVRQYERHYIFRVSVLFGPGKANFINKGLCKAWGKEPYVVASDQMGSATYTLDAARTMMQVFEAGVNGTFHLCNQGACTRYELARHAVELAGLDPAFVVGKPMSEMRRPGPRLTYAVMQMKALKDAKIELPRHWESAVQEYVKTLTSSADDSGRPCTTG